MKSNRKDTAKRGRPARPSAGRKGKAASAKSLYHSNDFVALNPDDSKDAFDVALFVQDMDRKDKQAKVVYLKRLDKDFFVLPADLKSSAVKTSILNLIGPVAMMSTEEKDCFKVAEDEAERIGEGKEARSMAGDSNLKKIR